MTVTTLVISLAVVPIWIGTGLVGLYYRRWMIFAGFTLAGLNGIPRAIALAGGRISRPIQAISALTSIVVVGLICGAYLANRPGRRPGGWTT